MSVENGEWVMYGVDSSDPYCLHTPQQLIDYINDVGFVPLFRTCVPGLSVEERTTPYSWWTDDPATDPWQWRQQLAAGGQVAYGKFFGGKAGFVSLEWFPYFANWRRDGYDFDSRWEDELATRRSKKIMDLFVDGAELFSYEAKQKAGFGKGGEKNFSGIATELQMQTYLVLRDFRQRLNKQGEPYGWPIAVYCTPEHIWGSDMMAQAYKEDPQASLQRILAHFAQRYPAADEKLVRQLLK